MRKEFNIWNRITHESKEISLVEAEQIINDASFFAGHYNGMGGIINAVLFSELGNDNPSVIEAVHCTLGWLRISTPMEPFISRELAQNDYEC